MTATPPDPIADAPGPALGELDLHLLAEGTHERVHAALGAQVVEHEGAVGVRFAVWAPDATGVAVVGDFNAWRDDADPMERVGQGIWTRFVPEAGEGSVYKFAVTGAAGTVLKADPVGRAMELRPGDASVVHVPRHAFQDDDWLEARAAGSPQAKPIAVYEVHLGSWRHHPRPLPDCWYSYTELADALVDHVVALGFTHVELMPVMEHPLDKSWGYQVSGYYAATARYGSPDELRYFVDRCHQRGVGVILDWVPAHFPKDASLLGRFDGTALYEHLDPRLGEHRHWGTYVFNFGRTEVKNFLIGSALYWFESFHVDGLRCDAVASMLYRDYGADGPDDWVPNERGGRENLEAVAFLRELNERVHARFPGALMIAEESTAWPGVTHDAAAGGLGFDLKWNMGWMHDTLAYFQRDPIHRSFHHHNLTFGLMYAFSERFMLPLSHDEVVHLKRSLLGKMAGDRWQRFANLRALYAHMWAHPGKKLLFMGGELGVEDEWSETTPIPWGLRDDPMHAGVERLVADLNALYKTHPPLHEVDHDARGFEWIDANDSTQSVVSYVRYDAARDGYVVVVANFTPVVRHGYRVGVPRAGRHRELLNTDADAYGGSGVGNMGAAHTEPVAAHGHAQSLVLALPPLGVLWLAPEVD